MGFIARYLTHPQVRIDSSTDVQNWSLNEEGQRRIARVAASNVLIGTRRVISSAETKALESAGPLAASVDCCVEVRSLMHENDRSATGFLPPAEFERVADQFFANPSVNIRGWESALQAQQRIVSQVRECLKVEPEGDVLFVGHGGVGTLLMCELLGVSVSRDYDQGAGGGGNYFQFSIDTGIVQCRWLPIENLIADC